MGTEQRSPSYYALLGVTSDSPNDDIKRAYRKLAMQWHPDRWARTPSLLGKAKRKFQQIQEAYSVLSDRRKRTMYDAGLYDPEDEEDEGLSDFVQEMLTLMAQNRKQNKSCTLEELQAMLVEMAQDFEYSSWYCGSSVLNDTSSSKRARCDANPIVDGKCDANPIVDGSSCWYGLSGGEMYEASSYCS